MSILFKHNVNWKYAIGEVVLIFFGITLAVAFDNWNEERKDASQERAYLERFLVDLQSDTAILHHRMVIAVREKQAFKLYLEDAYKPQHSLEEFRELRSGLTWNAEDLILQDKTYAEVTNSGRLNIIRNNQLRDKLISYYRYYDVASEQIAQTNQTGIRHLQQAEALAPFLKFLKSSDFVSQLEIEFNKEDWEYINESSSLPFRLVENAAIYYALKHEWAEPFLVKLLNDATELVTLIQQL